MKNINFATLTQNEAPIFIFASGHRCGSTLLQRLLNSHPNIMIWGEQKGALRPFMENYKALRDWEAQVSSARKAFLLHGYDQFSANMMPEGDEIRDAAIAFMGTLFGASAAKLDRNVWGFKEVRYGVDMALFIQSCFPKARFIHLIRDVADCFVSMRRWELDEEIEWIRPWTILALENWKHINQGFAQHQSKLNQYHLVKYEEMVANPKKFIVDLATFLEETPDRFDHKVFKKKLTTAGLAGKLTRKAFSRDDLTVEEKALFSTEVFAKVGQCYGYGNLSASK